MEQYSVSGMSCAACSARVEKAVLSVNGVTSCSVSLLTNSMAVEGSANAESIISAVKKAGYSAEKSNPSPKSNKNSSSNPLADTQTPALLKRFIISLIFLLILSYISMGRNMFGFPLPSFLESNPLANGILQLILAVTVMVINQNFFVNGFKGLIHRAPNMDTLVALGSAASFIYSLCALFNMTVSPTPEKLLHEFYFESSAMIPALITFGKMLESASKGKTTNALKALLDLAPKTATVLRNGEEITLPIESVIKGDLFLVRPGETVSVDGVITEGDCSIDESALTGESIPVNKGVGDLVSAGTVNCSGFIKCEATRVGEDTTLSQIIKMVSDAAATKAPIAKIADKVSGVFVPIVITIALMVFAVWMILGQSIGFSLARAISVLVISCPCALGLATPVAIMVGNGKGAKNGILFKTATSVEVAGKTQIIALDKTGTITYGKPEVTDVLGDVSLLQTAYSLEIKSEHPLARAIVEKAKNEGVLPLETTNFKSFGGGGVEAEIEGKTVCGGNADFIKKYATIPDSALDFAKTLSRKGKTPMFFAANGEFLGTIAVVDSVKPDSAQAVKELQNMGICVVMLTGDNKLTAHAVAEQVGVDKVVAQLKPEQKEEVIKSLKKEGTVAMVGDGINDAPALTRADVGIAIGAGTDVAIDAANIVLVNSNLSDLCATIRLSRATLKTIKQNLFWALLYNSVCIPVAAGVLVWAGITLNPMIAAAAMSLSSFCVVTNALRLNLYDMRNPKKDKKIKQIKRKKEKEMQKIIKIEGMMCPHCEARVKQLLEGIEGVSCAQVSHSEDRAILTLSAEIENQVFEKIITENGYKVIEII